MESEYTGNIYMITGINKKILSYLQKYDIIDDDYLISCNYVLVKENVDLIKINENCYVDSDSIKSANDFNNIATLINNGGTSNLLMKRDVYNPYIGQLFVKDIKKVKTMTLNTQY